MIPCIILTIIAVPLLILFIREKIKAYSVKATLIKSIVSVLFIAVAVVGTHNSFGNFITLGLVFGLLGDIWLDFKYVFPKEDRPFTYAGFAVFGVGHILFIIGMLLNYASFDRPLYILAPILLAVVLSLGNAVLEKPMKMNYGELKPVVITYGALLFSTCLIAGSLATHHHWQEPALTLVFIGGILFAISDLILSGTYFSVGKERPIDIASNYAFYYAAQFVIAFSALVS